MTRSNLPIAKVFQTPLHAIILINVLVTVVVYCAEVILKASSTSGAAFSTAAMLALPASFATLLHRPWTVATYMFTQTDLLQLICNMLWLWIFGRMFDLARGNRKATLLWWLYIAGGIGAAICFIACCYASHSTQLVLIGSSGATLAVICATALRLPDFRVNLLLFGMVKLKWIAVAAIVFFVFASSAQSMPSAAAHAGGALTGIIFALGMRYSRTKNISFKTHRRKSSAEAPPTEAELDEILKKVSTSGYSSLSAHERRRLIEFSKNR